jgi:PAS domain S-box-containing protein
LESLTEAPALPWTTVNRTLKVRTLLVEPCPATRAALAEALTRCGCDVVAVASDEEACRPRSAEGCGLAVLGVDRMLDHGFWLCRRLRATYDGHGPFIFALAERWDAGRLAWLLEAGVDDCLATPLDEVSLAARVAMIRQRVGLRDLDRRGPSRVPAARHQIGFFCDTTDRRRAEAMVAQSEARFRALFEGAPLGMVLCDREGRLLECNGTFLTMIGQRCESMLAHPMGEFTHPDDRPAEQRRLAPFLSGTVESVQIEKRLLHADGGTVWCRMTLSFLPEPGDSREHIIGVVENITDRMLARRALRESERMLRDLVENLPDVILIVSAEWTIHYVNRKRPDASANEAIGQNALSFVSAEYEETARAVQERLATTREVQVVEVRDRFGAWWTVRMVPFENDGEKSGFLLICTDVTEKKIAAEAVAKEQQSLRRMLELLERDRALVAFEIHDGFAQQLTGALLNFEAARQAEPNGADTGAKSYETGLRLLRESIAESRRLVRGLRPPVLDEFGIVPAIEHLIEDHHAVGGGRVELCVSGMTSRLAHPLESALFRIVQETLNNARQHSQSERIEITLSQDAEHVVVEVRDWGIGFDPEKVGTDRFGLRGIAERTRLLGGAAEIEARPNEGTRIRVQLPVV